MEACEYFCPLSVVYRYNKYIFDFIDIYRFIQVSGCVGMGGAVVTALYSPGKSRSLGSYTITRRNKTVNVYKIKHIPLFIVLGTSNKLSVKALNNMPYTTYLD